MTAVVAVGALAAPAVGSPSLPVARSCVLPPFGPGTAYHPVIDPASFSPHVTNPWFPLAPGTTFVYTGTKDAKQAVDVVTVSARTRVVDGVTTRVVNDRLYLDGRLAERTSDYYAQDRCSNVWYFGEDTAELDAAGHVTSRAGSFRAGVAGAQPGVFVQADPQLGRWFRQEWAPGQAADQYKAVSLRGRVSVPYASSAHALRTVEITALEPGVVDNKYYLKGVGVLLETSVRGPVETLRLVDVLR